MATTNQFVKNEKDLAICCKEAEHYFDNGCCYEKYQQSVINNNISGANNPLLTPQGGDTLVTAGRRPAATPSSPAAPSP